MSRKNRKARQRAEAAEEERGGNGEATERQRQVREGEPFGAAGGTGEVRIDVDDDGEYSDVDGGWTQVGRAGSRSKSTDSSFAGVGGCAGAVGVADEVDDKVKAAKSKTFATALAPAATASVPSDKNDGTDRLEKMMEQMMGQIASSVNELNQKVEQSRHETLTAVRDLRDEMKKEMGTVTTMAKTNAASVAKVEQDLREAQLQHQDQVEKEATSAPTVALNNAVPVSPVPPFPPPRMAASLSTGGGTERSAGPVEDAQKQQQPSLTLTPQLMQECLNLAAVAQVMNASAVHFPSGMQQPVTPSGPSPILPDVTRPPPPVKSSVYSGAIDAEEEVDECHHEFSREEEEKQRLADDILSQAECLHKMTRIYYYMAPEGSLKLAEAVERKIDELYYNGKDVEAFQRLLKQIEHERDTLQEKVDFLKPYVEQWGAIYVGHGEDLETVLRDRPKQDLYVFCFNYSERDAETAAEVWQAFERLLQFREQSRDECQCLMVDQELRCSRVKDIPSASIKKYRNGDVVCQDVLSSLGQLKGASLAVCADLETGKEQPAKRTVFEAPCPNHFREESRCPKDKVGWQCVKCFDQLEYGFDNHFYCSCGRGEVKDFKFNCGRTEHKEFTYYPKDTVQDLVNNLKMFDGLTILILGETGVGKSTFINGFANYLTFNTLEDAKGGFKSPVKSTFVLTNDNDEFDQVQVTTGSEENESQVTGQSATQDAKAHVFKYKGSNKVRLIDTPGIGDTRGIEQDRENFQKILSYLSYYDEIHGICVLLKPNDSRLTVMFEFCLKELLTHLHKSAAENIVFCFTKARITSYRPGETLQLLREMLRNNRNIPIALRKQNVYCMDNESFRYLAALDQDIKFDSEEDKMYTASWDKSKTETDRLMEHVSSLKPHMVQETVTINSVRRQILDLTKPLAEIAKQIDITVATIQAQEEEIEDSEESAGDLLRRVKIQVPTLERRRLSQPRTVCTGVDCSQTHYIDGQRVKKFVVHCHPQCGLRGVQADTINNPDLKGCWAMHSSGGHSCSQCGCEWNVHMHVTYEMESVTKEGEDEAAKRRYDGITNQIELKRRLADDFKKLKTELETEKQTILKACAKFGLFLKKNSVMTYNDAMMGYLNLMIKQARDKADQNQDYSQVNSLVDLKRRYEEELEMIRGATEVGEDDGDEEELATTSAAEVQSKILKSLFTLKHYGNNLKKLLREIESEKSVQVNHSENVCCDDDEDGANAKHGILKSVGIKLGDLAQFFLLGPMKNMARRIFSFGHSSHRLEYHPDHDGGGEEEDEAADADEYGASRRPFPREKSFSRQTPSDTSFNRRKRYDNDMRQKREGGNELRRQGGGGDPRERGCGRGRGGNGRRGPTGSAHRPVGYSEYPYSDRPRPY